MLAHRNIEVIKRFAMKGISLLFAQLEADRRGRGTPAGPVIRVDSGREENIPARLTELWKLLLKTMGAIRDKGIG
jgi:hypothetical protein